MKNIFISILFFCGVYQAVAQDSQLLDNEWFLQKVIIDDVDIFPPFESVIGELVFSSEFIEVIHPNCEESLGGSIEYMSTDLFELSNAEVVLLGTCGQPDVIEFMDRHYSIYRTAANDGTAKNPFNYTFEEDGGVITLTVTNVEGDQGIYTNELLGVSQIELNEVVFYPNPVHDEVTIISPQVLENSTISIFNLSGKRVVNLNMAVLSTTSVNVANLKRGVYFLELTAANGAKRIEKIIKL